MKTRIERREDKKRRLPEVGEWYGIVFKKETVVRFRINDQEGARSTYSSSAEGSLIFGVDPYNGRVYHVEKACDVIIILRPKSVDSDGTIVFEEVE